jgi:hypothetical protein
MSMLTTIFFTGDKTTWEEDIAECHRCTIEHGPPLEVAETHPWH